MTARLMQQTGLDDAVLRRLVNGFYDRVRRDAMLGPIFAERISDWAPHLDRMVDFWSSVALMSGRYHGSPMLAHLGLPVEQAHFDRWLELFSQTAREICTPEGAEHVITRARRIAASIHGNILDKRDGYGCSAAPPKLGPT
ncbi:group III truncated hemoglobin [Brevirhabdus sp.]|uniref:group III truncated hemoglobin n=1 Tax=Brevirhabdus sp. TaxID=2004514 RepID=UPI0040582F5C